jgi:hypothetical protein
MNAQVTIPFELLLPSQPAGIAGLLAIEIYDPSDGSSILAPSGTGITEPRPGSYRAQRIVSVVGSFVVRWTRSDTSVVLLEQELIVTATAVEPARVENFATLDQLAMRLGQIDATGLTAAQQAQGNMLLGIVTGLVIGAVGRDDDWAASLTTVPAVLTGVCLEACARVMQNPSSARSESETLGQYSHSASFTDGAHGLMLTDAEEMLCRRAVLGALSGSARLDSLATELARCLPVTDGLHLRGCAR